MLHKFSVTLLSLAVLVIVGLTTMSSTPSSGPGSQAYADSLFDVAVNIIKKYEGMHTAKNWPYVGYGHRVLPGESYKRGVVLSQSAAEALLRKDLKKFVSMFTKYGADSLILGVLAYNIGPGNVNKSSVLKLLDGDEEALKKAYVAHCRYLGKVNAQIQRRRNEEFDTLYHLIHAVALENEIDSETDSMVEDIDTLTLQPVATDTVGV